MMTTPPDAHRRGSALITGVGRRRSIGAALALELARAGWDLALSYWHPYDERLGYDQGPADPQDIAEQCRKVGANVDLIAADLADPEIPATLIDRANARTDLRALVMSHCESVDSSIATTSIESWDRHFAVNARANWLLIQAFAQVLPEGDHDGQARGWIVALTSDHTAHNLPYGASKGALDRIVIASATELAERGIRANVINPGPIDTGWMDDSLRTSVRGQTPAGRLGTPTDTANLVRFLLSPEGSWINGQLLFSNGGIQ